VRKVLLLVMSVDLASPTAHKVKAQLQFYFSDSNYPRDKFLRGKAAENDGWIPLDVIATFSRMKQMTSDLALIVAIAKSCEDLTVSEDGLKVKRKSPIPEKDTINERSVYVKGLPVDSTGVSIESLSDYFSSFGKVLSVRLRRDAEKAFKGKAYVEFATQADADKAAKNKEQTWGADKKPLEIFTKTQYFDARKLKTKSVKEEKKRKRDEGADSGEKKDSFVAGVIVELKGVPATTERENIKDIISVAGQVRYVDFHGKDQGIALVRFTTADGATTAQSDIASKKIKIGDADVVARILEGDEEKKYWAEKVTPYTTAKEKPGNRFNKKHRKE